ncbi:MAG: nucleotidyltransferase family protein, partial [Planctomycetota bacterium]|nr:nucleotidyltransferase family protein [Planctomycetota bacterium]
MKAIILCAGFGTRLKPLTDHMAKPLIQVAGRPILDHIIDKVLSFGEIDEVLVVSNQRFFADFESWAAAGRRPIPVRVLNDGTTSNETRKGAVGDMLLAVREMRTPEDFLVVGGDNIFTFDLNRVFGVFSGKGSTLAVYDVGSNALARLYGVVELDPDGRVTAMTEKPEHPATTLASICVYMYVASVTRRLVEYEAAGNSMDATGSFAAWLCSVEPVYGCPVNGVWFDIGDFESLANARAFFEKAGK